MISHVMPLAEPYGPVHYAEMGHGEEIVLLHGVGVQLGIWSPQMSHLARTHRVIAVDLPGHGKSAPLEVGSTLEDFVSWLGVVFDHLKLGPINLVGHSMGSLIALGFTATQPERVRRLALLNAVFRRSAHAREAVILRAKQIAQGEIDHQTALARWFGTPPSPLHAAEQVKSYLEEINITAYATAYLAFARGDSTYADAVAGLTCPLLALTAEGDQNSTPAMSREMAHLAQDGEAFVVNGHGHNAPLTAPAQVNAALDAWLARPEKTLGGTK